MARRYDDTALSILGGEGVLFPKVWDSARTGLASRPPGYGHAWAAMARIFAREAAQKVALDGPRYVVGAADAGGVPLTVPTDAITAAQAGLIADMDLVADILYGRTAE